MADKLTISLAHLPEEGQSLEGELSPAALATTPHDLIQPHSPLYYELYVQRFDSELLIRGSLEATMELTCVRSAQDFLETFVIDDLACSIEITSGLVDLTDTLREELFIELPINPICDEAKEKMPSEANSRYLAVDKPTDSDVNEPPAADGEKKWSNNWDALDGFNDFSDKKD